MEKEEFIKRIIENQIFDELKDGYVGGVEYIRRKYQGVDIDYNKVHRRIINYRIARYGTSYISSYNSYPTKEEYIKRQRLVRQNKHDKGIMKYEKYIHSNINR